MMPSDFNPHTATNQELRDWLAREDGWKHAEPTQEECDRVASMSGIHPATGKYWKKGGRMTWIHPHPNTLDAAAGAMPEGWWWEKCGCEELPSSWCGWRACKSGRSMIVVPNTNDEITDRFRLAALAKMAEKENTK